MKAVSKLEFEGIEAECKYSGTVYRIPRSEYKIVGLRRYAFICPHCGVIHTIPGRKITHVKEYKKLNNKECEFKKRKES